MASVRRRLARELLLDGRTEVGRRRNQWAWSWARYRSIVLHRELGEARGADVGDEAVFHGRRSFTWLLVCLSFFLLAILAIRTPPIAVILPVPGVIPLRRVSSILTSRRPGRFDKHRLLRIHRRGRLRVDETLRHRSARGSTDGEERSPGSTATLVAALFAARPGLLAGRVRLLRGRNGDRVSPAEMERLGCLVGARAGIILGGSAAELGFAGVLGIFGLLGVLGRSPAEQEHGGSRGVSSR